MRSARYEHWLCSYRMRVFQQLESSRVTSGVGQVNSDRRVVGTQFGTISRRHFSHSACSIVISATLKTPLYWIQYSQKSHFEPIKHIYINRIGMTSPISTAIITSSQLTHSIAFQFKSFPVLNSAIWENTGVFLWPLSCLSVHTLGDLSPHASLGRRYAPFPVRHTPVCDAVLGAMVRAVRSGALPGGRGGVDPYTGTAGRQCSAQLRITVRRVRSVVCSLPMTVGRGALIDWTGYIRPLNCRRLPSRPTNQYSLQMRGNGYLIGTSEEMAVWAGKLRWIIVPMQFCASSRDAEMKAAQHNWLWLWVS